MSVYVVTPAGKQLMPTSEYRARKLLKSGKAVIFEYRPFTIMLTRVVSENVQTTNCQFDMIQDEKKHQDNRQKMYHARRKRRRYRKPKFDNRKTSYQ